jgi:hypothetical protein
VVEAKPDGVRCGGREILALLIDFETRCIGNDRRDHLLALTTLTLNEPSLSGDLHTWPPVPSRLISLRPQLHTCWSRCTGRDGVDPWRASATLMSSAQLQPVAGDVPKLG